MTLTNIIYNILDTSIDITIPTIFAGFANESESAQNGLLTFFQLPSPGVNFTDNTTVVNYQFDIYHSDIYQCEEYKDQVIKALSALADYYDGKPLIFVMTGDNGTVYESNGDIYHNILTFGVKTVR